MHDSLPTRQILRNRGIIDFGLCPLCNCEEESTSHLFLLCPFARACWHGLPLAVHTSDLIGISMQQWLRELIVSHNLDDEVFMEYMQNIFITLWTIWTHRNMVVHEETTKSHGSCPKSSKFVLQKCLAYEAKDLQGVIRLYGVASSKAGSTNGAVQEALMEAVITAKNYEFHRILFSTDNKNLVQLLNKSKNPAWQERSLITDMEFLYQSGLVSVVCNLLVVPKCVLDFVYVAAKLAIRMPSHHSWVDPTLL
ncbi:hypothetical protein SO802_001628 [Lithocarpus litseifolius]|uniref:Reverse transcriptase zinc-binding domain-containing protein n=1 Tax=Lithocarpus litseifolius TaxID=425828 RepID=A0AAW2DYR1_9ROSI